jgi:RHS repeat-associated protein
VLKELPIYGSSRLGVYKVPAGGLETDQNKLILGRREYELTNHLGNVLATVSDAKLPAARVLSFTDYYAFGGAMPGRSGGAGYRYGFNGKEDDAETGWQDYGMRMYNPELARFFTVDPISDEYPELTPYQFASNSPISGVDLDGLEWSHYVLTINNGRPNISLVFYDPNWFTYRKLNIVEATRIVLDKEFADKFHKTEAIPLFTVAFNNTVYAFHDQEEALRFMTRPKERQRVMAERRERVASALLNTIIDRIPGPRWSKVKLGGSDLSKATMKARRAAANPDAGTNFATIEYTDLDGKLQQKSFQSTRSGPEGHTEAQAIRFLEEQGIPLPNLKRLHTELIYPVRTVPSC